MPEAQDVKSSPNEKRKIHPHRHVTVQPNLRKCCRFWVRKINSVEKDNINLRSQMTMEIPYFLFFLLNRKLSTQNESRMWFTPAALATPALQKIKKYNTNKVEMEIANYCLGVIERLEKSKMLCCPVDFLDIIRNAGLKTDINQIRSILKDSWGLWTEKNSHYNFYHIGTDGELSPMKRKGRYFEISRNDIDEILL